MADLEALAKKLEEKAEREERQGARTKKLGAWLIYCVAVHAYRDAAALVREEAAKDKQA